MANNNDTPLLTDSSKQDQSLQSVNNLPNINTNPIDVSGIKINPLTKVEKIEEPKKDDSKEDPVQAEKRSLPKQASSTEDAPVPQSTLQKAIDDIRKRFLATVIPVIIAFTANALWWFFIIWMIASLLVTIVVGALYVSIEPCKSYNKTVATVLYNAGKVITLGTGTSLGLLNPTTLKEITDTKSGFTPDPPQLIEDWCKYATNFFNKVVNPNADCGATGGANNNPSAGGITPVSNVCIGKLLSDNASTSIGMNNAVAGATVTIPKANVNAIIEAGAKAGVSDTTIKFALSVHPIESVGDVFQAKNASNCVGLAQFCPGSYEEATAASGYTGTREQFLNDPPAQMKTIEAFMKIKLAQAKNYSDQCIREHFVGKSDIYMTQYAWIQLQCPGGGGDGNGTQSQNYAAAAEANYKRMLCDEMDKAISDARAKAGPVVNTTGSTTNNVNSINVCAAGGGTLQNYQGAKFPIITQKGVTVSLTPGRNFTCAPNTLTSNMYGSVNGCHDGVDIASVGFTPNNHKIVSISDGTVTYSRAQGVSSYGVNGSCEIESGCTMWTVRIKDPTRPIEFEYIHLALVGNYPKVGDTIKVGDTLGALDMRGGPHLHLTVIANGFKADPALYIPNILAPVATDYQLLP